MLCPECKEDVVPERQTLRKHGRPALTMLFCPSCETVLNAAYMLNELERDLNAEEAKLKTKDKDQS